MSSSFAALAFFIQLWYAETARGAGPAPKGGKPMSTADIIGILMLVIAAISLGFSIGKGMKQPPPDSSKKRQFQAINLSDWPPSCSTQEDRPSCFIIVRRPLFVKLFCAGPGREGGRQNFFPERGTSHPVFTSIFRNGGRRRNFWHLSEKMQKGYRSETKFSH